jgi:hypothetical protein
MDAYRIKACGIALSWRDLEESVPAILIDDLMLIDQAAAARQQRDRKRGRRRA